MNALTNNLWKEWRDHRTTIAVLTLMSMALVSLAVFLVPSHWTTDAEMPFLCAVGTLVAFLMLSGGDVLTHETNGSPQRFLARLPEGLGGIFRAKLAFFIAILISFALLGWITAFAAILFRTGEPVGLGLGGWNDYRSLEITLLVPVLVLGSLTFGVSTWVPRGAAAFPAAVIVLGAALSPRLLLWIRHGYDPSADELGWQAILLLAAGLAVGWLSFTRWRRFERHAWRAALPGLGLVAVVFLPMWADCAGRFQALADDSPSAEGFRIRYAILCGDQRHLIAPTFRELRWTDQSESSDRVFVIDLETGAWVQPLDGQSELLHIGQTTALIGNQSERREIDLADGSMSSLVSDMSTSRQPSRRPQRIHVDTPSIYDYHRARRVDRASWPVEMPYDAEVFTSESKWLVRGSDEPLYSNMAWSLYDPATDAWTMLPWPQSRLRLVFYFPGGFLLFKAGEQWLRASMADESLRPVEMPSVGSDHLLHLAQSFLPYGFSFEQDPICLSVHGAILIYDDSELRMRKIEGKSPVDWSPVGSVSDGGVVAIADRRRIVHLNLETGEEVQLFPRVD